MKTFCYYTVDQVKQSGLLSEERFAELEAAINARISPAYDQAGEPLKNAFIVDMGSGKRLLFARVDQDHSHEHMRREAMAVSLTDEELELINQRCLRAIELKRDAERFEKAKKVTEWDAGVWWGDEYFHTIDDLLERLEDEESDDWPVYVWAAAPQQIIRGFTVWDLCGSMVSDLGWEDMGESDLNGVKELQEALDRFTEANKEVVSYRTDCRIAVLMDRFKNSGSVA